MKRMYYMCMACLVLLLQSVSAQVADVVNGYPVVDLGAFAPLGTTFTYNEAKDRLAEMNAQTVSNTAFVSGGSALSATNGTWNARMSAKYQVMQANLNYNGSVTMDWATAWTACKAYSGEGGSAGTWRLPTQGELQMIWVLHPQLIGKGGFAAFLANDYWSSTEGYTTNSAWYVAFNVGLVNTTNKTNNYYVRCVRDLP